MNRLCSLPDGRHMLFFLRFLAFLFEIAFCASVGSSEVGLTFGLDFGLVVLADAPSGVLADFMSQGTMTSSDGS